VHDGWHQAFPLAELAEGVPREVRVGFAAVLLVRLGDAVHAVSPLCPHKFTPLDLGGIQDGAITCAQHAACFDLATGRPRAGQEWAGQLPVYPTRVREGMVEVQLPDLE
jgi:nitrite reductase/ring-hydroxylating ferredoxin subunit